MCSLASSARKMPRSEFDGDLNVYQGTLMQPATPNFDLVVLGYGETRSAEAIVVRLWMGLGQTTLTTPAAARRAWRMGVDYDERSERYSPAFLQSAPWFVDVCLCVGGRTGGCRRQAYGVNI